VQQQRDGKQSRALRAASAADGELCLEVKGWWLMHLLDRAPPGDGQVQVRSFGVCADKSPSTDNKQTDLSRPHIMWVLV